MAQITIEGRPYEVAPYKIGKLRRAAPFIDRINATAGSLSTLEGMMSSLCDICEVASIGLIELDDRFTPMFLEDQFGMAEMEELQTFMKDLLEQSGLARKGEAPAPSAPVQEGASQTSLDESSTSSSAPGSKAEANAE